MRAATGNCWEPDAAIRLLEQDLRHHAFVFMVQKMAMEERNAADNWIGEIHHQVHRAAVRDVHGVEPYWMLHALVPNRIYEEVHLMDVERMHFFGRILDSPVLQ